MDSKWEVRIGAATVFMAVVSLWYTTHKDDSDAHVQLEHRISILEQARQDDAASANEFRAEMLDQIAELRKDVEAWLKLN